MRWPRGGTKAGRLVQLEKSGGGSKENSQDPNILRTLDKVMNEFVFGEDSKTVGSKEDWI